MKRTVHLPLHIPTLIFAAVIFTLFTVLTHFVLAHGGDTSKIHGCVRNNILNTANIRIVDANTNCANNETALDWNIQGVPGPTGVPGSGGASFINCNECTLADVQLRYNIPTTSNHNFDKALLDRFQAPVNTDFSGSTFINARIRGGDFHESNLSNTNWSNAKLAGWRFDNGPIGSTFFSGANLTSAIFSNADLNFAILTSANLTNANFINADLSFADLNGATTTGANFTGVNWRRATCPDGTILEDEDGVTCEGHGI